MDLKEQLVGEFDEIQKKRRELVDSGAVDKSEFDVISGKAEGLLRAIDLLREHQMEVCSDEK